MAWKEGGGLAAGLEKLVVARRLPGRLACPGWLAEHLLALHGPELGLRCLRIACETRFIHTRDQTPWFIPSRVADCRHLSAASEQKNDLS